MCTQGSADASDTGKSCTGKLRARRDAFAGYGETAITAASEICALLAAARDQMRARLTPPPAAPTVAGKRSSRTRAWLRALRRSLWLRSAADRGDRAVLNDV